MKKIKVEQLADEVMKELEDYANTTTLGMKAAVQKTGNTVRNEIRAGAPSRTGAYAKSWSVKNTKQNSHAFEVTIYSRTGISWRTFWSLATPSAAVAGCPEGLISRQPNRKASRSLNKIS